jgi:hypothetical protein
MKKGRKVTSKNISQPPTRAVGRQKGNKKGGSGGTPVSTAAGAHCAAHLISTNCGMWSAGLVCVRYSNTVVPTGLLCLYLALMNNTVIADYLDSAECCKVR